MKIRLIPENSMINRRFSGKVEDLIRSLNMKPDEVIVIREKRPIPIDDDIDDKDEVEIVRVSSGG